MKKIFLAALMCLGLTACSSGADSEVTVQTTVQTEQTTVSQVVTAAETVTADENVVLQKTSAKVSETEQAEHKETIVIYFSATGTTKGVAEKIAAVTDADIFEIIPAEPYTDADLDWNDKNSRTTIEMNDPDVRPAIENDNVELDGYKTMYIGYPIWWGEAPRIMSTFVEAHSFDDMTVIPFCTSGGSSIGRSDDALASQAGSGKWLDGDRLNGNISEDEIKEWINDLK
ncbi:MAG: flavodoxin [Oscillospiraceae bacterium]|nr:flavodoxin [Oscillospiraceae bacterium]